MAAKYPRSTSANFLRMNGVVQRLRSESQEAQQKAAVNISTYSLDKTIDKQVAEQATPLLEELLQTGEAEKQGAAAGALARIAHDYKHSVRSVENDLISLLWDDTVYQKHYYNSTQAISALAALYADSCLNSINRAVDWYQDQNAQRAWAAAILTIQYLAPEGTDAVDYRHIDFIRTQGVTLLAQQHLDNLADDYAVAAILLDDILTNKEQKELRDTLLVGGRNHPERLEDALPHLKQNIRNRQHRSAEYALWILRKYAEIRPEELTQLIDHVAAYLSPSQGMDDPGNATGLLAEVVEVAPQQVATHRERLRELRNHKKKYVRKHCARVLIYLDDLSSPDAIDRESGDFNTIVAHIDRISSSGNGIIEMNDGHLNLGPVTDDCVGTKVKAEVIEKPFARCRTRSVTPDDYEEQFQRLVAKKASDDHSYAGNATSPAPQDKEESNSTVAVEFCDNCGTVMKTIESSWQCSSCGAKKPKNETSPRLSETGSVTDPQTGNASNAASSSSDSTIKDSEPESESVPSDGETDLKDLRKEAVSDAVENVPENVITSTQTTTEYTRSQKVIDYVKARADGYCEGCSDPAPFISKTGEPYLHAHHVHELSKGGSDTPETVIALCPNCHYLVHHGKEGENYNKRLKQKLKKIEGSEVT